MTAAGHALRVTKRAAHRPKGGSCTRCGLLVRDNNGWCPPGFWMSKADGDAWTAMADRERSAFERRLATVRVGVTDMSLTDKGHGGTQSNSETKP